jgi:lactoylglutathione lyase
MIRVKDIDASLKFYTEVLDMELDHKKRLDDCWLYFLNDKEKTCQIELTYNDETPENGYEIGTGFGHFAFAVDSLDEFTAKIEKLGYKYLYEPFDLNGKVHKYINHTFLCISNTIYRYRQNIIIFYEKSRAILPIASN